MRWHQRFTRLGSPFFSRVQPTYLPAPYLVDTCPQVSELLGIACPLSDADVSVLSGNANLSGSQPFATVYSGHQFGVWAGQLGDGRALLLGELVHQQCYWELQLKGCGLTPYSRMGDGRAVLRSSIREYLCSEAMAGLGIPTTRALAIIGSDLCVMREEAETAAVVARVAPSFIRFGHFEHFSARKQYTQLRQLADFVIDSYYPECRHQAQPYAAFLGLVINRTAALIAHWQAVGFCHGVLNTDNMSILGLTLDYGPFGFLDAFDVDHVCNHSDSQGRYAYNQQPSIGLWNLTRLAEAMLPLLMPLTPDEKSVQAAQTLAIGLLAEYVPTYQSTMLRLMRAKLGLCREAEEDGELIEALFDLLDAQQVDFTLFFRGLCSFCVDDGHHHDIFMHKLFIAPLGWVQWAQRYRLRLQWEHSEDLVRQQKMWRVNPKYVLRQHLLEVAIAQAKQKDFSEVIKLREIMTHPFDEQAQYASYADLPPAWASTLCVSCSS
ncbi:MAG: YdiU family protein [Ottowia sp.]|nr:YdiU family protein [Ottowia sp.]